MIIFQAVFHKSSMGDMKLMKPKMTDRSRVVNSIIRYSGPCLVVRLLAKNIRNMATKLVKGILYKYNSLNRVLNNISFLLMYINIHIVIR